MSMVSKRSIRYCKIAYVSSMIAYSGFVAAQSDPLVVSLPPAEAQQAVLRMVREISPQREERRRYRLAFPFGAPLFPPDEDIAQSPVTTALATWLALPATVRQHDVLITPDVDYYWNAEGRQYSCQFVVHIAAQSSGSRVKVIQLRPVEYAGRHFELLGRTGPGRYIRILSTSPSAETEKHLKRFLAGMQHPR
nr:hypothetical protein [uncultured Duganella sp.]